MNRYAALGITLDALDGQRILIVTPTAAAIPHALDEFTALPPHLIDDARIRRANGDTRIDFPGGGSIHFHPAQGHHRPAHYHSVFLDEHTDERLTHTHRANLTDHLRTTGGSIIRA
ncbi:hypothetical protein ACI3KS_05180 [Microbacterium sp. ZW T5_45]|uniref:hypothetical protein n=1 Tax=Microbacterium sp. ZW T5_45 TaxID=3378080 RepID=UPI003852F567